MDVPEKIIWTLLHHSSVGNLTAATRKKNIVVHTNFGQFGNIYITIRNLIILALYFGFDKVFIEHSSYSSEMFSFDGEFVSDSVPGNFPDDTMIVRIHAGVIYHLFQNLDAFKGTGGQHEKRARAILGRALKYKCPALPDNAVVIHLRGGGIFSQKPQSPGYGQPPLAWYKYCLDLHRENQTGGGRMSVVVVHEDEKNPCLPGIISYCNDRGIPVRKQSGSLQEDYGYLMHARHLIDSVGTFTFPAIDQNQGLESLYCFRLEQAPGYIGPEGWRATPEQLDRLLNMQVNELAIPDDFYGVSRRPAINGATGTLPFDKTDVFERLLFVRDEAPRRLNPLQKGVLFAAGKAKPLLRKLFRL